MSDASNVKKVGRNDPCHCGSGEKYKKCHLAKDEQAEVEALKKQQATDVAAAAKAAEENKGQADKPEHKPGHAEFKGTKKFSNTSPAQRIASPRRAMGG